MNIKSISNSFWSLLAYISEITLPKQITRPKQEQEQIDNQTKNLTLYQFHSCPYCILTRRNIYQLNLNIKKINADNDPVIKQKLILKGGKFQVPCLRINNSNDDIWMYESSEIIHFLNSKFAVDH